MKVGDKVFVHYHHTNDPEVSSIVRETKTLLFIEDGSKYRKVSDDYADAPGELSKWSYRANIIPATEEQISLLRHKKDVRKTISNILGMFSIGATRSKIEVATAPALLEKLKEVEESLKFICGNHDP